MNDVNETELHKATGKALDEQGGWIMISHEAAGKALAEVLAKGGIYLTHQPQAQLIINQAAELGRLANALTDVADWLDDGRTKTGINAKHRATELREMATRVRSVLAAAPAMPTVEVKP